MPVKVKRSFVPEGFPFPKLMENSKGSIALFNEEYKGFWVNSVFYPELAGCPIASSDARCGNWRDYHGNLTLSNNKE